MELMLIVKAVTLGADLFANAVKAYEANRSAFSSQDQAVVRAAIAQVAAVNDVKEDAALAVLRGARAN
jgi:hypothetical protein